MEGQAARKFETGATRSPDAEREDPEGFLSPLVEQEFCHYMAKHRKQSDGLLRNSDNWQRGMPLATYMKGLKRHVQHLWLRHRGWPVDDPMAAPNIKEDLCALLFNVQGYLHEILVAELGLSNARPVSGVLPSGKPNPEVTTNGTTPSQGVHCL